MRLRSARSFPLPGVVSDDSWLLRYQDLSHLTVLKYIFFSFFPIFVFITWSLFQPMICVISPSSTHDGQNHYIEIKPKEVPLECILFYPHAVSQLTNVIILSLMWRCPQTHYAVHLLATFNPYRWLRCRHYLWSAAECNYETWAGLCFCGCQDWWSPHADKIADCID